MTTASSRPRARGSRPVKDPREALPRLVFSLFLFARGAGITARIIVNIIKFNMMASGYYTYIIDIPLRLC